jgi:hypothetical protein
LLRSLWRSQASADTLAGLLARPLLRSNDVTQQSESCATLRQLIARVVGAATVWSRGQGASGQGSSVAGASAGPSAGRRARACRVTLLVSMITACDSASKASDSVPLSAPDGGRCATHRFLYDDVSCPPGAAIPLDAGLSPMQCTQEGDLLCHERCTSDADCSDRSRPYCRILGLFAGYDWNCNVGVRICRGRDVDDCKAPPELR